MNLFFEDPEKAGFADLVTCLWPLDNSTRSVADNAGTGRHLELATKLIAPKGLIPVLLSLRSLCDLACDASEAQRKVDVRGRIDGRGDEGIILSHIYDNGILKHKGSRVLHG